MSDNDKMNITDTAGGAAIGTAAAYGVSAYHGNSALSKVNKLDLFKKPSKELRDATVTFHTGLGKIMQEHHIDLQNMQTAQRRSLLKLGELHGIDINELLLKKIRPFEKLSQEMMRDPENFNPEKLGLNSEELLESVKELAKGTIEIIKAVHQKTPTVADYLKFSSDNIALTADTIAETLGKSGAERKKFAEEYTKLHMEYMKSTISSLHSGTRRLFSSVEYAGAKWYEKPLVAFESMSLKGKVGIGAIGAAGTLVGAYLLNHMRGGKDSEPPSKMP